MRGVARAALPAVMPGWMLAAALLLAGCSGAGSVPALGRYDEAETVPVRLGLETRPALAEADDARARLELRMAPGTLVVAFGWKTDAGAEAMEETAVRVSFRDRERGVHALTRMRLPAVPGTREGWQETLLPVPGELVGRSGSLVFETEGEPAGGNLFAARPQLLRERAARPNLILVSIDTLRADRLGCYGHPRPTSPAIDALAAEGTRFANVYAPTNWTLPSHYTMMTSLYPSAHGVNPDRWLLAGRRGASESFRIRGSGKEETLAERLEAMGYFTAAVTESGWVDARFGFDQGFASYVGHGNDNLVEGTQKLTLAWLEAHRDLPFFLFVHTYQAHQPYHQPPPYDRMFVEEGHIGYAMPGLPLPMELFDLFKDGTFPPMPADVRAFSGLYDGEVRYVDAFVEALRASLRELDLERDTVVLFTSDHGEEIFERGNFDHGETLYDEVMRVPLILWGPGRVPAGETRDTPVAVLDVLPTLVELAGGEVGEGIQGRSLTPLLGGETEGLAGRVLFGEGFADESVPMVCAWDGSGPSSSKAIFYGPDLGRVELFDLARDPGETVNVAERRPETVARLREQVLAWQAENARIHGRLGAATQTLDEETQERLRALGYL